MLGRGVASTPSAAQAQRSSGKSLEILAIRVTRAIRIEAFTVVSQAGDGVDSDRDAAHRTGRRAKLALCSADDNIHALD